MAAARIEAIEPLPEDDLLPTPSKRAEPRIPFGVVVESGLLLPGSILSDDGRRFNARVNDDGSIVSSGRFGHHHINIHQVGAAVQGAPACNGWTFWHVDAEGQLLPIDTLRQQIRARMN